MTAAVKKFLLVFGVGGLIFWLTKPGYGRGKAPKAEQDIIKQQANARIALDAFLAAVKAGENAAALDELNREIEEKYSLRVYFKRSDGHYYVADTTGKDILRS
jgi:hypothetical protein